MMTSEKCIFGSLSATALLCWLWLLHQGPCTTLYYESLAEPKDYS